MIRLRAMEPTDIDMVYSWENDPAVWVYSAAHQPFSRHALERFIDENDGMDIYASRQLRLMADDDGETIGCIDLFDFDPYHRRAAIGMLVDSRHRGKGYGSAILDCLEAFASKELNLHLLYCDIAANNTPCLSLFRKHGFQCCGTKQEWIWNGERWGDAHTVQKIIGN